MRVVENGEHTVRGLEVGHETPRNPLQLMIFSLSHPKDRIQPKFSGHHV